MPTIRVILADDHALVRAGIRSLLNAIPGIEVIAEASDGREALRLIKELMPDVVLMDVTMPGMNGLEATSRVTQECPTVRVIMLSMYANEEYILQAVRIGAAGYILKDADVEELATAIRLVAQGETYLSPALTQRSMTDYLEQVADGPFNPFEQLTPRQREILQLIAEGHNTKKIAQKLGISDKTVEAHRIQLMERLKIYDIPSLVRYAIRMGLVGSESP